MKREKTILAILVVLLIITLLCCWFVFRKVAQRDPWQEQYDLGTRYLNDGNYQEAVIAFLAAIDIDPWQPPAYSGAAQAYMGLGDRDAAVAILAQGAEFTGDKGLAAELAALQGTAAKEETVPELMEPEETLPEGASKMMTVSAQIIYNPDIYESQWDAYIEQYQREEADIRVAIDTYGVQFDPAITAVVDGAEVTVSEACLVFIDWESAEENRLLPGDGAATPVMQVTGYLTRNGQTEELAWYDSLDGEQGYSYRPNGDFVFTIVSFEVPEA